MKKKLLFLGGSMQQVPAIKKAKELGYTTVLIDFLPDNPGQHFADKWYMESTTDVETVYDIARKEQVQGILPYASDPAALPAAIVAERLGLPTNPATSVAVLGVKHNFRAFLRKHNFACPNNFTFSTSDSFNSVEEKINKLKFPIVIKPTDSSGSKGVSFINSPDQLNSAIEHASQYSRNRTLIAEEFIERGYPWVIGGDIFVENGMIILYGDMACLRDDGGKSLIPIGKKKPNGLSEKQSCLLRAELQRLIDVLDIKFGELNIEVIIDKEDKPHFLEVGPRAGGNMIPIQLSDAFGVDLIKANVQAAMGETTSLDIIEPNECYMTFVLHSHENGKFVGVEYAEEIKPYIYRECIYKQEGDAVEVFDGAGKAIGIVFMRIPTVEQMNDFEQRIDELIKVQVQ